MHGRHTKVRPHHWVAGAVAVLVAVSVGIAGAWVIHAQTDEPTTSGSSAVSAGARQLQACRAVWQSQSDTLAAADRSLAQWRVHVGAMNQLVAGQITLAQAQAFWNRTRVGAAARVAKFEKADSAYADVARRCPSRPSSATASRQVRRCVAGVRARHRAIDAGSVAIATWKHHIRAMEMLRSGQLTPQMATQMWLQSWHRGVRQLDAFTKTRQDAADAGTC